MSVSDAIRDVTSKMQAAYDNGEASAMIDLHDLVEALLAIADAIDSKPAAKSTRTKRVAKPKNGEPGPKAVSDLFRL